MKIIEIILTAISLATDAFAASIGRGISKRRPDFTYALTTALAFGVFQAVMPLIGWIVGSAFAGIAGRVAPVVSFVLLCGIGVGMIYDTLADPCSRQTKKGPTLIGLAVATSIDALSAGIGLGMYGAPITVCSLIIGGVTFLLSIVGVLLGNVLGSKCGRAATFLGGVLLCGIGIKILVEAFIGGF
jgi:putative Mn2+ efflux pump MntP